MRHMAVAHLPRALLGLLILILGCTTGALGNRQDYPEFAQQNVAQDIPIAFITAERVKQRIDEGVQQILVDVRRQAHYEKAHLPGAMSIPLQEFPQRAVEIPRDMPVVLY